MTAPPPPLRIPNIMSIEWLCFLIHRNQCLSTKFPFHCPSCGYFVCSSSAGGRISAASDGIQVSTSCIIWIVRDRLGELGELDGVCPFYLFDHLCVGLQHSMSVCSELAVANRCGSCVLGMDWLGHLHFKVSTDWDLRADVYQDLVHVSQNVDFDRSACHRIRTHVLHAILRSRRNCKSFCHVSVYKPAKLKYW